LKRAFWEELKVYEEECQMPYVTSVEETGMFNAIVLVALNMLRKNMDLETIGEVTGLTIAQSKSSKLRPSRVKHPGDR
jgi:hypothetical protein